MLEGFDLTVSYTPVSGIVSLCTIVTISYVEGLIIFILEVSNALQNTIYPNPEKRVYLSLTHLYLKIFERKRIKHPF